MTADEKRSVESSLLILDLKEGRMFYRLPVLGMHDDLWERAGGLGGETLLRC